MIENADHTQPTATPEKPEWTPPILEEAGTIRDVAGGGNPGLDSNNLPAAIS